MQSNHPINSTVMVYITHKSPRGCWGEEPDGPKAIVHTREIAWDEPRSAQDHIDQTREAVVIGYNPACQEAKLSLRLAERDPWERIEDEMMAVAIKMNRPKKDHKADP